MAKRTLTFYGDHDDDGDFIPPDRQAVRQCLMDLEGSLYQLGGMVYLSVDRHEIAPDEFLTVGYVITHDTFAPAKRAKTDPEPVEEPEDLVPEPIEEGAASV